MADANQPPQQQEPPGETAAMDPKPQDEMRDYVGRDLLRHKRALITGGDSGIGRARQDGRAGRAARPARTAERGGAGAAVPGMRGRLLHDRQVIQSERRYAGGRLSPPGARA